MGEVVFLIQSHGINNLIDWDWIANHNRLKFVIKHGPYEINENLEKLRLRFFYLLSSDIPFVEIRNRNVIPNL